MICSALFRAQTYATLFCLLAAAACSDEAADADSTAQPDGGKASGGTAGSAGSATGGAAGNAGAGGSGGGITPPPGCTTETICVDGSVSETGDGSAERPFKTIQEGADEAQPSDTVMVLAGTYQEKISIPASGQPGKPITFAGQKAADGALLVQVQGGTPVTAWVHDPGKGFGVYKTTGLSFVPETMVLDGSKDIPRLGHGPGTTYDMFKFIGLPADHKVTTQWGKAEVNYWDGIGALFGHDDGTTYVKFRDGSDPNAKDLRAAPTGGGFDLTGISYITVRDFQVRGFQAGVLLSGSESHHNIIEGNDIATGTTRVEILDGAHSNHVRDNEMHMGVLDTQYLPGAWDGSTYELAVKEHIYNTYKHEVGRSTYSPRDDSGINIQKAGAGNEIYRNHVYNTLAAVNIQETSDLKVFANELHNTSSGTIVQVLVGENIEVFDNLIYDGNFLMRFQSMQDPAPRSIYIYRNRFWNPKDAGSTLTYFHHDNPKPVEKPLDKQIWFYHNCFAGHSRAYSASNKTVTGTHLINNVFSSESPYANGERALGLFDYNWVGGSFSTTLPSWWGSNNINAQGTHVWDDDLKMPDFELPAGHAARAAGRDLSKSFSHDGITHTALPGMTPGYFAGSAPNIGCKP